MRELVRKIRSGEIDLLPLPNSGWYDRQVYSLESLLLPGRGEEANKLLLTSNYKKRALEAFEALITKRRETHVRHLEEKKTAEGLAPPPRPKRISPRLRLEPSPTYLVRTARAYAFLETFLTSTLGEGALRSLHGLRAGGTRIPDLATELRGQRDLFFGLYLVSCEDLGLAPSFEADERVDQPACYQRAVEWLEHWADDPDLKVDPRVGVPISFDPVAGKTRLWAVVGVRLTKLSAEYVRERPPSIRTADAEAWSLVSPTELESSDYLIAVDEFVEVDVPGLAPPDREELRKLCDQAKTKEAIVQALQRTRFGGGTR
jgi:hypothetical protein